jgi:hypothetical protein
MIEHPELDKEQAHKGDAGTIAAFLEWLEAREIVLCEAGCEDDDNWTAERYYPVTESRRDLLYAYFGIDQEKAELERRAILADFVARTGGTS